MRKQVKPIVIGYHIKQFRQGKFSGYYQAMGNGITFDLAKAHVYPIADLASFNNTFISRVTWLTRRLRPVYKVGLENEKTNLCYRS